MSLGNAVNNACPAIDTFAASTNVIGTVPHRGLNGNAGRGDPIPRLPPQL